MEINKLMNTETTSADARGLVVGAVDDSRGDLVLLEHVLKSAFGDRELTIHSYCDPQRAVQELCGMQVDVMLVDFSMGEMTGLEFLEAARAGGVRAPAILLTDQGDERLVVSALHAGFADYLRKRSLSEQSLNRAVSNALEKFALSNQAAAYRAELEGMVRTLVSKNREIASFYHTLAHELKTPLTSAREFVSIVIDGVAGSVNAEQRECLEVAVSSCDRLRRCIDDLFDVSRIDTGKLEVVTSPGSLAAIVRQATVAMLPEAAGKGVDLRVDIQESDLLAEIDKDRIVQVMTNLIGNALKFTASGGQIVVRCQEDQAGVQRVSVTDSGQGIAPEDLEHIFDRLYQSDGNAAVTGGMGLGLHLCQQLVSLHGGSIRVTSELGKGSEFHFLIPSLGGDDQGLPQSCSVVSPPMSLG